MAETELEILSGSVAKITYRNALNGYTVMQLETKDGQVTVVGNFSDIEVGEYLELTGKYTVHATYGQQFKATYCEHSLPSTQAAILKYLSSGVIKGIGPATAKKILRAFGEESFDVIANDPKLLSTIKGITLQKAEEIKEVFEKRKSMRDVCAKLARLGFTAEESILLYTTLGADVTQKLEENPYIICSEGIDISFEKAEDLAFQLEFEPHRNERLNAGIIYILKHNLNNGHTCLPYDKTVKIATELLECDSYKAADIIGELVEAGEIVVENINGTDFVFLEKYFEAESYVADRLVMMQAFNSCDSAVTKAELSIVEDELCIDFDELQKNAIKMAVENGVFVLTGGPGTGKTTTINGIIRIMENRGMSVSLAAPTGRAAKRMTELTGYEAKTLHRLLEVGVAPDGVNHIFKRNQKNPLDCNAVIVDEMSMVDVTVFEALLAALPLGCRLIMVGDSDQLPSVSAGNVLNDVLSSEIIPAIRLKKIFRQAMKSKIVVNAHKIINGEELDFDTKDSDFFMLSQHNPQKAVSLITDLVMKRLLEAYGFSSTADIQVLCPSKKLETGTVNLNNVLQQNLNPPSANKPEIHFKGFVLRQGDKVMQIKNNYDIVWQNDFGEEGIGVFNGDVGVLEEIDKNQGTLTVRFDDKTVVYTTEEASQLELAYAITVHKSQGSEYDCVVLSVLSFPQKLKYRNLLYTAVTRARKLLVIVGSKPTLIEMAANTQGKSRRYTALKYFLENSENAKYLR